jgi:hypothetical protein
MATTTTNFGWDIPQSTDLVKDGATAIAALGQDIDTAMVDLKGGTTGQVLAKASGTDLDFSWVAQDDSNAIQNAIVDAKGDLIGASAADTPARLAVGTNGQVLTADSTAATGLAWATASAGSLALISNNTFSGVSSYSLANDTFTSSYNNYLIILTTSMSANNYVSLRLRAAGTDNTSSNYSSVNNYVSFAGVSTIDAQASQSSWTRVFYIDTTSDTITYVWTLTSPQSANKTAINGYGQRANVAMVNTAGFFNDTTSFDSMSFIPLSGTITGKVQVYGYAL